MLCNERILYSVRAIHCRYSFWIYCRYFDRAGLMKSQSNSQELEQILRSHAGKVLGTDYDQGTEQTIKALDAHYLQLALSCLPEKNNGQLVGDSPDTENIAELGQAIWDAQDAAIDTMERNIRGVFS